MRQTAPDPEILADLVARLTYKPGWWFELADEHRDDDHGRGESAGLTFTVHARVVDSYHPDQGRTIQHLFIVPAATYNEASWRRWLLDRVRDVESHEACEFFQIDGLRPYPPNHGPGEDPYRIAEVMTDEAARTSFRGVVKPT